MRTLPRRAALPVLVLSAGLAVLAADPPRVENQTPMPRWRQHDVSRPHPKPVAPADPIAAKPPADAVLLFDGTNLDAWKATGGGAARWRIVDGAMETVPGGGGIETKAEFGDVQLHIEWAAPAPPHGKGQDRGNSGVFLMNQFEIQVLDSYQADTYADGQAGAIYGQYPPLFNASRPPGEWQSYDIAFRRPRFDASGQLVEPARITVFHNGLLVQNNEEPFGPTSWLKWASYQGLGERGPISLQDHDHPVKYRNIWLREMPERALPGEGHRVGQPKVVALPETTLDRYAGRYSLGAGSNASATITRVDDHLSLELPFRKEPLDLWPLSETEFDLSHTDGRFTFRMADDGRVTGVHFRVGDSERDWSRVER